MDAASLKILFDTLFDAVIAIAKGRPILVTVLTLAKNFIDAKLPEISAHMEKTSITT